ncbi:Alpha-1-antitrypsin [Thelohanellus kitauei]|uniref:Alpha-1-antitrypsin n=1 Tax=Thelohanellus kitauei TaxID=669202 RepID=A0A0C2MZG1_THEKT|nr:Alpha-1-antitrypsin [Thelohanellus kitauei]
MADIINDLTLKLANYFMADDDHLSSFSVNGLITYLTLSLVNIGLLGPVKYQLLDFLKCNYTFVLISYPSYFLQYKCVDSFTLDEFLKIGNVKSAIFHSSPIIQNFRQIAHQTINMEFYHIDPKNKENQSSTIFEWARRLEDISFQININEPYEQDLSLLVMNQYYTRFQWKTPFHLRSTKRSQKFTDVYNVEREVQMMRRVEILKYCNDPFMKASMVFIPLQEDDLYAAVVLPYFDSTLKNLLKIMTNKTFESWFDKSFPQKVDLRLPKFGFDNKISLKPFLEFHQLSSLFNQDDADLSNMVSERGYLNDYIHVSSIKINESGSYLPFTEDGQDVLHIRYNNPHQRLTITKPFLFYIYKSTEKLILHFSVITHPVDDK